MNFDKDLFAKTTVDDDKIKLGGHKLIIMNAEEYTSAKGTISLKVSFDTASDDVQPQFFTKKYKNSEDKKWPNQAIKYIGLSGDNLKSLKRFITSLEQSNNFKFNCNGSWDQLKKLKCAGQFGLEQFVGNDGETKTTARLVQFRSIENLDQIEIPNVKLVDGTLISYDDYIESIESNNNQTTTTNKLTSDPFAQFGASLVSDEDDSLPF